MCEECQIAAEEELDVMRKSAELAIHKIEQTQEGQYPEGQALDAAKKVLQKALKFNSDMWYKG